MRPTILARIAWHRTRLRRHETWTRARLEAHQSRALGELRAFAMARSPLYRELYRGREKAPLTELPVLTKEMLVNRFDDLVTDRSLRSDDLAQHIASIQDDELFRNRYWVTTTSGSSGLQGLVLNDAREWAIMIASYRRAAEWTGVRVSPWRVTRAAFINSRTTFHQSSRIGRTLENPLIRACRLDAGQPLPEIVDTLNTFQPEVLIAYASMIRILAEAQLRGQLRITPRILQGTAEVLTPETRSRAQEAWGIVPFDVYATTETGGLAAECDHHQGLHLFEDLVIAEVVDHDGCPVAPGEVGERLLVTVLHSRTLPLIRYELPDRVRLAERLCSCGRASRLIAGIEGRAFDVFDLPGRDHHQVSIHPVVFVRVIDQLSVAAWQVWHEDRGLRVMIVPSRSPVDHGLLLDRLRQTLRANGVDEIEIRVEEVAAIPPGAAGKRPLIRRR